eukprot:7307164-Prymnesium_polylepis.1
MHNAQARTQTLACARERGAAGGVRMHMRARLPVAEEDIVAHFAAEVALDRVARGVARLDLVVKLLVRGALVVEQVGHRRQPHHGAEARNRLEEVDVLKANQLVPPLELIGDKGLRSDARGDARGVEALRQARGQSWSHGAHRKLCGRNGAHR